MQQSTNRRELTISALRLLNLKSKNTINPSTKEIMVSCPIHGKDRTPSMGIDLERGIYNCFACGAHGTIENLYRTVTGQSLNVALGLNLDSFSTFANRTPIVTFEEPLTLKNVYLNLNKTDFKELNYNPDVLKYLRSRGISLKVAHTMQMKYVENSRINGTLFKRRLIIPIYENNKLISIEGRRVYSEDPDPKVLYPKNCTVNTLFDIDNLDKQNTLYACEGLMDLAVLRTCDLFKNSTSIFGANLTQRQVELFKQFPKIVYIPDLDAAGTKTVDIMKEASLKNVYILPPPKTINNCAIKDIGDIPKARATIQQLVDRRWLSYQKPLFSRTNYSEIESKYLKELNELND